MKTLLLLLFPILVSAQSVNLSENTSYGGNCGNGFTTEVNINGDLNLNNYILTLRNVNLNISGNLNGYGEINRCGNYDHSTICVFGVIQNTVNLNGISCNNLDIKEFDANKDLGHKFTVYNILGQVILEGFTTKEFFYILPKQTILIIKIEGFKTIKLYKNLN